MVAGKCIRLLTDVSNRWTGIWNGMMEWKMELNSEHTKLQLSRVTGTVQSSLKYPSISRAVISPQRLYEQVSSIAQMFLRISKRGTVVSLSSVIIVVLQSPTLT